MLVEAFAPRRSRFSLQIGLSVASLVAAVAAVAWLALEGTEVVTAGAVEAGAASAGSIVIDGPSLFLQGTIAALAVLAVLTMSERGADGGAFTPQAVGGARRPGRDRLRRPAWCRPRSSR